MPLSDAPATALERVADHEARIKALEDVVSQLRSELAAMHSSVKRLEINEEKREARVMAAVAKAESTFVGGLADLRVEAAESRAQSWRRMLELVVSSGGAGGALGTGVYVLLQSIGGGG